MRVRGRSVETAALAGSAPRGRHPEEDERFGEALLASEKERAEHTHVVAALESALEGRCESIQIAPEPRLRRLFGIQHLETSIRGRLLGDPGGAGIGVLELVEELHPTPAVGGVPRAAALAWQRRCEGLDRGWYAAPIGWLDLAGGGDFSVALRSALISADEAGAGLARAALRRRGSGGGVRTDARAGGNAHQAARAAGAAHGDLSVSTPLAFEAEPSAVYTFVGRFFEALSEAGIAHVVASPGSRSTPLTIGASRAQDLRLWISLDERAAAFFALGLALESGRPAAVVCTSGTAAANYLPAVVEAHYARVPLLLLTADRPPELRDWGAGQTIEQAGLFGRYPRWAAELPPPASGEDALRYAAALASRAVAHSVGRSPGPVHLNWPLREPLAPPNERGADKTRHPSRSAPRVSGSRAVASSADVAELVDGVRRLRSGVICCGPLRAESSRAQALARFARAAGWPLLADPASGLRAGAQVTGAPILDTGDVLPRAARFAAAAQPEFVLRVGAPPVSKAQRQWIEASSPARGVVARRGRAVG